MSPSTHRQKSEKKKKCTNLRLAEDDANAADGVTAVRYYVRLRSKYDKRCLPILNGGQLHKVDSPWLLMTLVKEALLINALHFNY